MLGCGDELVPWDMSHIHSDLGEAVGQGGEENLEPEGCSRVPKAC